MSEPIKPGIKSTEFYLSTLAMVIGAIMGALPTEIPGEATTLEIVRLICGTTLAALGALGYTVSRGMAKKGVKILLICLLPLALAACCAVTQKSIEQVEASHELILPDYLGYVDKDAGLDADSKDDRKKLVESLKRVVAKLKKEAKE